MCPSCGETIKIRAHNTTTAAPPQSKKSGFFGGPVNRGSSWWRSSGAQPNEDAKRKFGEAVDLFYGGRYAESLAIFDALIKQFPGNPDIENGRQQCLAALRRPQDTLALEDNSAGYATTRQGGLDKDTVRRIVIEKMLRSPNEQVQLQAADLAARLLGMIDKTDEDEQAAEEAAAKLEEAVAAEYQGEADEVEEEDASDEPRSQVVDL